MIAIAKVSSTDRQSLPWQQQLECMLPQIQYQARVAFSGFHPEIKEELVAEVVANVCCAVARLAEINKTELAYPTVLTRFAIRQVRAGRQVGTILNVNNVCSRYAQRVRRIRVDHLDEWDHSTREWRSVIVEDRRAGPAETAAARIDLREWFRSLPKRTRRMALALARGESTQDVAHCFAVSPGRVSQLRRQLSQSWERFHGMP
jgi:hypothetical protein